MTNTFRSRQRLPRPYRSATRVRPIDRHTRTRGPRLLSQRQAGRRARRRRRPIPGGRLLLGMVALVAALAVWQVSTAHSETSSEAATRYWARSYGINEDYLWSIALCESGGRPDVTNAQGSGAYGLMQIKPSTWTWLVQQENADVSLAPNLTSYDPEWRAPDADGGAPEAHIAAWALFHHLGYLWECA